MKILNSYNKHSFNGLMDIRVRSRDKCYNVALKTSDEDDKRISSLISDGDVVDFYYGADDDKSFEKQLNKTNEFVKLIKNICTKKKLYFPKLDYEFDLPIIQRKDTDITFHTACDYGIDGDPPSWKKGYKWKQIDINLYTRKPEDIKQNITKLINENKKYSNFNDECRQMVNLIVKDNAKKLSFEEDYLLLLDNESILLNMNEKLKKGLKVDYSNELPF